ncbi:MAG: chemoreceptor glutamine deamidase CheD [Psychrosphaera sp.]|nr:chemoreceptor glutamine deamidase CheD [Psychrosphaera sp.]
MKVPEQKKIFSCYHDRRFDRKAIKLLPGDYFACGSDDMLVTVLGSCISVCLYESKLKIGGMNHFMLPNAQHTKGSLVLQNTHSARYGNVAMEWLINDIIKLGGSRKYLSAKIFGGGCVIRAHVDIGKLNIDFVKQYCQIEEIPVVSADVGGVCARKLYYIPRDNQVYVKTIIDMHNTTISERESQYRQQLESAKEHKNVFLFGDE